MNSSVSIFNSNLAEINITYRNKQKYADMRKITCSNDAEEVLRSIWSDQIEYREEFVILCLNRANKVLGYSRISSGGTTGTVADPKIIFQIALKSNASSIILAHNHPSGNTDPSEADRKLTTKLKEAGSLLDIPVFDHIILVAERFRSLADEGEMTALD
jgi:DNA repair protein RadC